MKNSLDAAKVGGQEKNYAKISKGSETGKTKTVGGGGKKKKKPVAGHSAFVARTKKKEGGGVS